METSKWANNLDKLKTANLISVLIIVFCAIFLIVLLIIPVPESNKDIVNFLSGSFFGSGLGGVVVWGRTSVGSYTATLLGAFPLNKTFITFNFGSNATVEPAVALSRVSDDFCRVQVSSSGSDSDNIINGSFIEIRVYD